MADDPACGVCGVATRVAALIRIDEVWMATEPLDMRAGADAALARVVSVFGYARMQALMFGTLFPDAEADISISPL